ncbi:glycerol-3-phosphate acyltransferase 4 isoform X1 [Apis mellifera caucasica]|uniref:Glycerol-3-phosphate acyltransferase 4 isoform X1 n=1 Tax=Apis mellifera TaxID=7460 RepID=A0A7M7R5Y8_APIME|nr:glycerol-3-phosphate acyltransferase 4 isoform X1 [Apis mellifera]KAG6795071.1 glycerol-3-phosphate acyltransferase 4 isoform X1 [Apis mellifera caucasica]KAG9428206.1 glycerol-3-phosphate acyltransferase 4 isoform X1 [Apis mellifera carnica]|eukprot:XP_392789.3 glycerol-3-phosphate acyltransferase 4 isoform X1 [Apis mellifera]
MAPLWMVMSLAVSLLLTPFLMFLLAIIFLASIGKSLGVRRLYIKLLLTLFEYGRQNIENVKKKNGTWTENDQDADEENESRHVEKQNVQNWKTENDMQNGMLSSNVIARSTDLILVPEPEMQNHKNHLEETKTESSQTSTTTSLMRRDSFETLKREFKPAICLDYIKAGVEAIIEDEVTSRFEAEELKNWNLLTRTNRHYEFISWKLTVIWMCGFVMRYCFLLPLRIFICFVGVLYIVITTFLIGFLPNGFIKKWIYNKASIIAFTILSQSISATITIHNPEYKPKSGGMCVANHTSTIDVSILSTQTTFSLVMWLTACTAVVGYVPEGSFKRWLNYKVSIMCFGVLSSALSSVITYHNPENRPIRGICVANHTSPIDVLVLMCDNCYSLIGQRHGGFLGILQRALARASPHIWFERCEVKDREAVTKRLKKHISDPTNPPILIFPEGTCINNTSVMQFKKGSFEVGGVIYPVAIKYDPRFGDAFWNSSRYSMIQYLYMTMSSWAIVCDVWYLPPMYRNEGESAIDFANRVKSVIARQGGLVDLQWDGQLKRTKPKKEWREKQQEEFSKRLKAE